jgi:hypothetical protein
MQPITFCQGQVKPLVDIDLKPLIGIRRLAIQLARPVGRKNFRIRAVYSELNADSS